MKKHGFYSADSSLEERNAIEDVIRNELEK